MPLEGSEHLAQTNLLSAPCGLRGRQVDEVDAGDHQDQQRRRGQGVRRRDISPRASVVEQVREVLSNVVDGKRAHPTNSGCLLHLAVDEWDTLDDLGDELVAVESVPVFLRIGGQFEDHAKGGYA